MEVAARWGPFTGMMGPERSHAEAVVAVGAGGAPGDGVSERYWAHPTHNTVSSTLRLIGERARKALERGQRIRAVAL
eukprot:4837265-Prymnesium_polylepis.1